jgi:hypothetical protein
MLTMKQLASLEKQGGGVENGAHCLKVGGREKSMLFSMEDLKQGSGRILLHYSRGVWTPLLKYIVCCWLEYFSL